MKPRIIVCGLGETGYKIFCLLKGQKASVIGISDRSLPEEGDDVVIGDFRAPQTLLAAGIHTADTLVLVTHDDALNLAILTQARVLNPHIRIVNRLFNSSLGDRLDRTLSEHVTMSVAALAAPVFAFAAQGDRAIGQLLLFDRIWPIAEEYIHEHHPWKGRYLRDLWDDISRMLIYYLPVKGEIDLISAVTGGQQLQVGDRLIVGTQPHIRSYRPSGLTKLLKIFGNLRQFQPHCQPIVLITLFLLVTILIATTTYLCFDLNTSFTDAIYFSVGMITGAGGKEEVAEKGPDSIKFFTAFMMLVGAGVVGIFYALLNDFVLGTRFKQFWDAARVPQKNHYIICGLGGIGVKIAQQLHAQGHEVAIVERDPQNRFLSTVRTLGIPVIQGDANLSATLKAAHLEQAEALLAVTSNDMVNVEIALNAKGVAPKLPVVVRIQDPNFARNVQEVFEFESVLSPPELAAPAFTAAALGGRILGNGMTGDTLWVALATMITPRHPFCGKRVQEVSMQADFVPLYIETKSQTLHGWDILKTSLSAGDILYLTVPANKLEQLWQITPSSELIAI